MPRVGDNLPLSVQLHDNDDSKFVRAEVTDADANPITGSPFTLNNIGGGLYERSDITMPNTTHVTAVYKIFNDSGFTESSEDHSSATDVFELIVTDQNLLDAINDLEALLNDLLSREFATGIRAEISDALNLVAKIKEGVAIKATVSEENDIETTVSTTEAVKATIDDNDIRGEV